MNLDLQKFLLERNYSSLDDYISMIKNNCFDNLMKNMSLSFFRGEIDKKYKILEYNNLPEIKDLKEILPNIHVNITDELNIEITY